MRTDGPGGGGVLTVGELTVDGKSLPRGVYTSSSGWLAAAGMSRPATCEHVVVSGVVDDPNGTVGAGTWPVLKSRRQLPAPGRGMLGRGRNAGGFPLTLTPVGRKARFSGFVTGNGSLRIEAAPDRPLEIGGASSNTFTGPTTLARGMLNSASRPGRSPSPATWSWAGRRPRTEATRSSGTPTVRSRPPRS